MKLEGRVSLDSFVCATPHPNGRRGDVVWSEHLNDKTDGARMQAIEPWMVHPALAGPAGHAASRPWPAKNPRTD
eukprot:5539212-Prymnesium_polylepis.1